MILLLKAILRTVRHPRLLLFALGILIPFGCFLEWVLIYGEESSILMTEGLIDFLFFLLSGITLFIASIVVAIGTHRTFASDQPWSPKEALFHELPIGKYFVRTLTISCLCFPGALIFHFIGTSEYIGAGLSAIGNAINVPVLWIERFRTEYFSLWAFYCGTTVLGVSLVSIALGRRVAFWGSVRAGMIRFPGIAVATLLLAIADSILFWRIDLWRDIPILSPIPIPLMILISASITSVLLILQVAVLSEAYRSVRGRMQEEDPNGPVSPSIFE